MKPNSPYYCALMGPVAYRLFDIGVRISIPFIGSVSHGSPVIGLITEGKPFFQTFASHEYKLIALWRAMKLLGLTRFISKSGSTFWACILLFHPERRSPDNEALIEELAEQFGGEEGLQNAIAQIDESFPPIPELDALLTYMHSRGVPIDYPELKRELRWYERRHGLVFALPILEEIRDEYENRHEKALGNSPSWWKIFWNSLFLEAPWR